MNLNDLLPAPRYVVCTETHNLETRYTLEAAITAANDLHEISGLEYMVWDRENPYGKSVVVYSVGFPETVDQPDRFFGYEEPR